MKTLFRLFVISLGLITFALSPAWGEGLTIPNTFTPGTTAKANEVNQNFSAVAAALPMAWATLDDNLYTFTDDSWVVLNTLNIVVSSDGILLITGTVVVRNHLASNVAIRTKAYIDGSYITIKYPGFAMFGPTGSGSESKTISFSTSTSVTAGAHVVTHELGGWELSQDGEYWIPSLNVVFFPTSQGTISSIPAEVPLLRDDSMHSVE